MSETTANYHECEILRNVDNISIQKIKGKWCWIYWNEKGNPVGRGLRFCPYCGKLLERRGNKIMIGTIEQMLQDMKNGVYDFGEKVVL